MLRQTDKQMGAHIGLHISIAGGYEKAALGALGVGADTFQFFTRNPRGGKAKAFDGADAAACDKLLKENDFAPIMAHCPYTVNMAGNKPGIREKAGELLKADFAVMELLPATLYNIHPGSHTGAGVDLGVENIISVINETLPIKPSFTLLLETMSGQGSEIGGSFSQLKRIIEGCDKPERLGVCLDTCHVFSAGYDIAASPKAVLEEFDRTVGLDRLKALHLNDSMNPLGSRRDRHEKIGKGFIGLDGIVDFISQPQLAGLPMFLETPHEELSGYKAEIAMLKDALNRKL